jgi:hypothetical protein
VKVFLVWGVAVPIVLHMVARDRMPWWPDTVSMGIVFGGVAVVIASKMRTERDMNRRLWNALKVLVRRPGSH